MDYSTVYGEVSKIEHRLQLLKERIRRTPYRTPRLKQDKVRKYFVERAIEIGEAALSMPTLAVPLFVLSRVLCEDTLWMLWVSRSRENAVKYHKTVIAAEAKVTREIAKAGRIRIVVSGRDATHKMLKKLSALKDERSAELIASELEMSKLYDIIYRWNSLYIHGNTFDLETRNPKQRPALPLSHIQAFLWVIFRAADSSGGSLSSQQVLTWLGLTPIAGANSKKSRMLPATN